MKKDLHVPKSKFPSLLHFAYILQQLSDELLLREVKVSLSHVRIMSALGPNPVSQRMVAMSLRQTEANVSRQLLAMRSEGLVSITKNKQDGRQRDIKLTAKGQRKYKSAESLLRKQQRKFQKLLDAYEGKALWDFSESL